MRYEVPVGADHMFINTLITESKGQSVGDGEANAGRDVFMSSQIVMAHALLAFGYTR